MSPKGRRRGRAFPRSSPASTPAWRRAGGFTPRSARRIPKRRRRRNQRPRQRITGEPARTASADAPTRGRTGDPKRAPSAPIRSLFCGGTTCGCRSTMTPRRRRRRRRLEGPLRRAARRWIARARSGRHPRAAAHARRRGRGRHHRQALQQQGGRDHRLPVRSHRTVLLLLRPPSTLRGGPARWPARLEGRRHRLRRDDRQRAAQHAAPAFRDFSADPMRSGGGKDDRSIRISCFGNSR